jgi:hypothetical protein
MMLYNFDAVKNIAKDCVILRSGDYSLYNVNFRVMDMMSGKEILRRDLGELNAPAYDLHMNWQLPVSAYYRIFFAARNGQWHQDLQLRYCNDLKYWSVATRVYDRSGRDIRFEKIDNDFISKFGQPIWRE